MNWDQTFESAAYTDQIHRAEHELASHVMAVEKCFGAEQARLSANDWLDECELMDSPPRCSDRNWRVVTVAALARLANRVTVASNRPQTGASTATKPRPIPSSNCSASTVLV
jgi:hypothetical protein